MNSTPGRTGRKRAIRSSTGPRISPWIIHQALLGIALVPIENFRDRQRVADGVEAAARAVGLEAGIIHLGSVAITDEHHLLFE